MRQRAQSDNFVVNGCRRPPISFVVIQQRPYLNRFGRVVNTWHGFTAAESLAVPYTTSFYKRFFCSLPLFRVVSSYGGDSSDQTRYSRYNTLLVRHCTTRSFSWYERLTHIGYRNLVGELFGRTPCNRALRDRPVVRESTDRRAWFYTFGIRLFHRARDVITSHRIFTPRRTQYVPLRSVFPEFFGDTFRHSS